MARKKIVEAPIPLRADRVRETREHKGLKQRELAELCGITEFQISRYENGKSDASGTTVEAMARHLGVSADYLLGLTDYPNGYHGEPLSREQKKLLKAYDAADWSTVLDLVSARLRQAAEKSGSG